MAIALATAPPNLESSHDPVSSNPQTPTWDPQEGDKDWKKASDKASKAAKRASAQRLVKPPPSASRTPHLMARQPAPGPPTTGYSSQSERSSSYGPPDHASIDQGSRRSRRRSDSVNSITSVSSIASKIKASFDRPRGRSTTPRGERNSAFLGGIKLQKELEAEAQWATIQAGPGQESYNIPARHMYRQPAGSSVARSHSRSSSCSAVSTSSLNPHLAHNPPPLVFPQQHRYRGPPVALRKPRPISRSGSLSRSPSVSPESSDPNLRRAGDRDGSRGPQPGSRNASRNASRLSVDTMSLNGGPGPRPRTSEGLLNARPRTGDSLGGAGLSDMAALSAVLKSIDLAEGIEEAGKTPEKVEAAPKQPLEKQMPDTKRRSTLPAENGTVVPPKSDKRTPPSASTTPTLAKSTSNDPAPPPSRRRNSSFLGLKRSSILSPMKARNAPPEPLAAPNPTPRPPQAPTQPKPPVQQKAVASTQEERPPRTSAIRQFRDAAKAAFHIRSPSAARGRSASVASGQLSPIGPIAASGQTSPFPGLSGVTTPVPAETPAATEPSDPWSSAKADTADARSRPPLAHQNNTTRGADRSSASVSSYDTAHSHHLSTVTPNTSRPESERGIVTPLVADDGRKFLLGRDRSGSPAITRPLAAVGARNAPTPPPGPMNGRRVVRVSSGGDILANGTASLRPKAESTTWPLKPEPSNQELDAEWTQVSAPLKQQSSRQPLDSSLLPRSFARHHASSSIDSNISTPDTVGRGSGASSPMIRSRNQMKGYSDDTASVNSDLYIHGSRDTQTPPLNSPYFEAARRPVVKGAARPPGASPLSKPPTSRSHLADDQVGDTLDKVLVQCCSCRYYHDMPSGMHERMRLHGEAKRSLGTKTPIITAYTPKAPEKPSTLAVRCPWCRHEMGIKCCSGFVATVHLKKKLH